MSAPRRFVAVADVANTFFGAPAGVWPIWQADLDRIISQDFGLERHGDRGNVDLEINLDDDLTAAVEAAARRANVSVENYLKQAIRRYLGLPTSHGPNFIAQLTVQPSHETNAG